MNRAAGQILNEFRQSILDHRKNIPVKPPCDTWELDDDALTATGLNVEDRNVILDFRVHIRYGRGEHRTEEFLTLPLSFMLNSRIRTWPDGAKAPIDHYEITSRHPFQPVFQGGAGSSDLVTCLFQPDPRLNSTPGMLHIRGSVTDEIIRFAQAKRGFPDQLDGQFVRMLYLSASTITTLGFGDIVPLTTPARLAVSLEAVLGILIMGLFLNAVAKER